MLQRAKNHFRSTVSGRMMFIYAIVLIAFFSISISAAAETIQITVKWQSTGKELKFEVDSSIIVYDLKILLYNETGIKPSRQRLAKQGGRELDNDYQSLRNYGIWNYSVLVLVERSLPGSEPPFSVPEEPVFYALPEDEIGAYAIRQDGTKEYLLFHTYDICMDWLASDELCTGFERCFHKDGK